VDFFCQGKLEDLRSPHPGQSYYASAKLLTAQFYEDLICRGWRRSGQTLYKPNQRAACCPHYTIRLDSLAFKATKDQRQSLNRFNRFVLGDDYIKECARLRPKTREEAARRKNDFDLVERVHESEYKSLKTPPDPAHRFEVTLEPDTFTDEKYELFENYQRIVHKEPPHRISKSGFGSFLCASPIERTEATIDGKRRKLGSYHQCYRLDGRLVAIGVLDLLPRAVSAVYFMYHEDIHKWGPGKLSALRETSLALEDGYRWYMMGFYIHSCKKMRYKAEFCPTFILDPESYAWDPLRDDVKKRLDVRKYVSMSRDRREGITAPENGAESSVSEIIMNDREPSLGDFDIRLVVSIPKMRLNQGSIIPNL
jgi:arginine-tRNA-protein transferase